MNDTDGEVVARLAISTLQLVLRMVCSDLNCYGESFRTFFGPAGFQAELDGTFCPTGLPSPEAAQVNDEFQC